MDWHGDFALVAAAALTTLDDQGRVNEVRVALGGISDCPVRVGAVEGALTGTEPSAERLQAAAGLVDDSVTPLGDIHASGVNTLLYTFRAASMGGMQNHVRDNASNGPLRIAHC